MAIVSEISITGGPYDSTEVVDTVNGFPVGDKAIDAAFIASMISCFVSNGVLNTGANDLKVEAADGLAVTVNPGVTWAHGYMARLDEKVTFDLSPSHEYTIFVRQNIGKGTASVVLYEDNTGWIPVQTNEVHDMVLAVVTVPSGSTFVSLDMISDRRGVSSLCGYVTSKI